MIIRDNRSPHGRDVGPVNLLTTSDLNMVGGGKGYGGLGWSRPPRPQVDTPATIHIVYIRTDPAGHEFKATHPARKWCSHQCQAREWYRDNRLHPLPVREATCHPDKKHYCQGLCTACYSRLRRLRVAQGNTQIPHSPVSVGQAA